MAQQPGVSRCKKVLFITHRVPYPPDKGDRIRTYQILRYLSGKAEVHLACLADEPVSEETARALRGLCARVGFVKVGGWSRWLRSAFSMVLGRTASEGAFHAPELGRLLAQWSSDVRFDACLVSASSIARYLFRSSLAGIPRVVDLIDVDSEKWLDYARSSGAPFSWLYALEGGRLRRLECDLSRATDALTLVTPAEVALFRRFCPTGRVEAICNGVDLDYFQPQTPADGQDCVFVGALDYRPNIDGVCWFASTVWHRIRARCPGATLSLVGRRPTAAVQRLARVPGVEVIGQVPDVRPYVRRAAVCLVPLRIARGVQNKVLEALALGKAVITSPQAAEGLQARIGTDLMTAATEDEWVDKTIELLSNRRRAEDLGKAGRLFVEQHHRWDNCLAGLDELLELNRESKREHAMEAALMTREPLDVCGAVKS